MTESNHQKIEFRNALGAFATGVTIVTTRDGEGAPTGVTASSFNSVSLDPPLVLWSLANTALSRDVFCTSGHFAIHVLAESQEALSNRFARSGEDKFANVAYSNGLLGSPLLDEYAAVFECRTKYQYEGGDHIILVGEVVNFERHDVAPLLFHAGSYAERRARPSPTARTSVDLESGRFTDDFLFYLLGRAYFQTSRPTRAKLAALGLSQREHMILTALSMDAPASADEITHRLDHTGHRPDSETLGSMVSRGLLQRSAENYDLAREGRDSLIEILAAGQAFEADLADGFTPGEWAETKRLLRKLVDLTGDHVPLAWRE
jgi:3-hydroxy-9,10-secoandrosta-1,3,5(10)-triene-9,17-dione monooxygenase reductase component